MTYLTTLTLIFSTPGHRSLPPAVFRPAAGATSFNQDLVLLAGSPVLLKADLPAEQA